MGWRRRKFEALVSIQTITRTQKRWPCVRCKHPIEPGSQAVKVTVECFRPVVAHRPDERYHRECYLASPIGVAVPWSEPDWDLPLET